MAANERSVKRIVEAMLAKSWRPGRKQRVVVLCYHSIHPSLPFASATPDLFRQHLQWLRAHCTVVPLRALAAHVRSARGAPGDAGKPLVAITFDDGYEDNYTYAFPLLREAGLTATIFVTTGLVAADPAVIRTFCDLYDVPPEVVVGLSWAQIREMREGGIDFGAHTDTHPNLSYVGTATAEREIRTSKAILEARLREPVVTFAYPFGKPGIHFNVGTADVVADLGFECAVAVQYRGVRKDDSPFALPRFAVTSDSVQMLAAKVEGKLDLLGLWQEWAPLPLARLVANDPSRLPEVRRRMRVPVAAGSAR